MLVSYSIKVMGRVQGVGFRFYTQKTARELGVLGFVKNMSDGSVYIEAEANQDVMSVFIKWIKQGPEWASVDGVSVQSQPVQGFESFDIR